jgi:flavin-dependent dehydrogenase
MREIEIIGGGLSGLSLGLSLRRREVPVRIIESGHYPRHKVCGEFVCGVSNAVLDDMGLTDVFSNARRHRDLKWWIGNDLVLQDKLPEEAIGLSRYRMDADLAKLFQSVGGNLVTAKRAGKEDADGRVWAAGKRKRGGRWIGLKVHARGLNLEGLEMHVGRRGYLGLSGIEDGRVNCCGLFRLNKEVDRKNILASYLKMNELDQLYEKFCHWDIDESSFSATAGFSLGAQQSQGAFCVGDASLLIPPFTGNGMSMAIESSWLATPWLEKFSRGELEWLDACSGYASSCDEYFGKRMRLAGGLHPLLFNGAGRSLLKWSALSGLLPFGFLFKQLRSR